MAISNLFSKRQRRQRGEMPDVYQYEDIPHPLRVQLVHILRDALGRPNLDHNKTLEYLTFIHDTLCREYGVFTISRDAELRGTEPVDDVYLFLLEESSTEKVLDAVELTLRLIDRLCRDKDFKYYSKPAMTPDAAIQETNERFREHGLGFQFESGEIIRVDSQIIHQSAVRPALQLLQDAQYQGANEEYLRAHEHYRHGRFPESLNDALKSMESTLKVICDKRKWTYNAKDTAKALLHVVFQNGLIAPFLQTHFATLQQNLESGVPTIRNKLGGHGQGSQSVTIPQQIVAYQLHLTASVILLLADSEKALS